MNISKRDTIVIAVLVNVALLAILFATALRDTSSEHKDSHVVMTKEDVQQNSRVKEEKPPADEIDTVLQEYAIKQKVVTLEELNKEVDIEDVAPTKKVSENSEKKEEIAPKVKTKKAKVASEKTVDTKPSDTNKATSKDATDDAEYYVIKSGDNPWKIARKFHVKYEDLLKLNGLDEEKAKNLKIGQKIRIK